MLTARQILADAHTIAVVGASRDPLKPAHWVPKMLQEQGWRIIPLNPHADHLFGERAYARLADIPVHVDVVDVFRPAREAPELAREAAAIGADAIGYNEVSPAQRLADSRPTPVSTTSRTPASGWSGPWRKWLSGEPRRAPSCTAASTRRRSSPGPGPWSGAIDSVDGRWQSGRSLY